MKDHIDGAPISLTIPFPILENLLYLLKRLVEPMLHPELLVAKIMNLISKYYSIFSITPRDCLVTLVAAVRLSTKLVERPVPVGRLLDIIWTMKEDLISQERLSGLGLFLKGHGSRKLRSSFTTEVVNREMNLISLFHFRFDFIDPFDLSLQYLDRILGQHLSSDEIKLFKNSEYLQIISKILRTMIFAVSYYTFRLHVSSMVISQLTIEYFGFELSGDYHWYRFQEPQVHPDEFGLAYSSMKLFLISSWTREGVQLEVGVHQLHVLKERFAHFIACPIEKYNNKGEPICPPPRLDFLEQIIPLQEHHDVFRYSGDDQPSIPPFPMPEHGDTHTSRCFSFSTRSLQTSRHAVLCNRPQQPNKCEDEGTCHHQRASPKPSSVPSRHLSPRRLVHCPDVEKLIAHDLKSGKTYREIAMLRKTSHKKISFVQKEVVKSGHPPPALSRGRPPHITNDVVSMIEAKTIHDPMKTGKQLAEEILAKLDVEISPSSVNAIRNILRFRFQAPRKKPALTPAHIEKRIAFATEQCHNDIDWEKAVVISDESRFGLRDDSRRIWIKRGLYNPGSFREKEKYPKAIMVWGAIGFNWRSPLIVIKGRLNAQGYVDIFKTNEIIENMNSHFGVKQYHFQQDGATCHTAKKTKGFLKDKIKLIENWPPNSPDCSCIENLWSILKQRVAIRQPQNLIQLETYLQEEWAALDPEMINSLLRSTRERFKTVLQEGGRSIGHRLNDIAKRVRQVQSINSLLN